MTLRPEDWLDEALDILARLVDDEDCLFDHDGNCQTHNKTLEPGKRCPVVRARDLLVACGKKDERDGDYLPFDPDWVIAPSETVKDYMTENGITPEIMAVMVIGRDRRDEILPFIQDVLDRKPLTPLHADVMSRATRVSKTFWLNLEHNYRVGLAAGKKDCSDGVG